MAAPSSFEPVTPVHHATVLEGIRFNLQTVWLDVRTWVMHIGA